MPGPGRPPVITSAGNAAVKAARKLARRPGRARAGEAFLVEGPRALREALPYLQRVFVAESAAAQPPAALNAARAAGAGVLVVADPVFAELATTVTPQGLVGVAVLPEPPLDDRRRNRVAARRPAPGARPRQRRDRTALGRRRRRRRRRADPRSVDPRNPKAVRASTGSLFHLPVVDGVAFSRVAGACRRGGLRLVAADAGAQAVHSDADLTRPTALVFGNEAAGLEPDVLRACDLAVRVPLHRGDRPGFRGAAESLNLAATVAIVTAEAARQRRDAAAAAQTL